MKVCISSIGKDLSAFVDPRFGRSQLFLFVDTETMEYECVENPALTAGGGAGTKAAQLVSDKGAQAVLTGNVGPNAFSALNAAGIKIYAGMTGTALQAVEKFKNGLVLPVIGPSVGAHSGMGGR
ncbi:MAG: NifB/NifX family molybdenum-iron cluster-binding protein [Proteobacteria bacterium]|nr:NifB/NifX family molybdenum-iron cluster-binding protein [Pseudomonadota bacterium]